MKYLIIILLCSLSFISKAQKKKIEFRGLYVGTQTISVIKKGERFYNSIYSIALIGYKKVTFNTQFIVPVFPTTRPLIKFGIDYKIW